MQTPFIRNCVKYLFSTALLYFIKIFSLILAEITNSHLLFLLTLLIYFLLNFSYQFFTLFQCESKCNRRLSQIFTFKLTYTGCLGLVHWDDPEGWYGEGGGGFRMGNMCIPVADSCWYMAKPIQYFKVKNKVKYAIIFKK